MNNTEQFDLGLQAALEATPSLSRRGKRILAILNAKPSKRRNRQLDRMERHARAALGVDKIDWTKINWAGVITMILEVLLKLLPLILAI